MSEVMCEDVSFSCAVDTSIMLKTFVATALPARRKHHEQVEVDPPGIVGFENI